MTIWKDVVGYEDLFSVSSDGQLFSKRTDKVLKQYRNKKGYLVCATKIGGRLGVSVCFKLHRLVADAFIENEYDKPVVNHKDGDKTNNKVENLEWVSHRENTNHAYSNGLINVLKGCKKVNSKFSEDEIRFIRSKCIPRHPDYGMHALARKFGVSHCTISKIFYREYYKDVD